MGYISLQSYESWDMVEESFGVGELGLGEHQLFLSVR